MELTRVRRLFPATRHINYLFNGGYCLSCVPVQQAVREFAAENGSGFSQENWDKWSNQASDAYGLFAELIGAHRDEIASLPNTSVGTAMAAHMIDPTRGSNVVLDDLEYQTVFPFTLRRKSGVEIRIVRNREGRVEVDDVRKAVDDSTAAIVVSSVSCWNGFRYDLKELSEIAHEHGAYLVVDAAQGAGAVRVDVHRDGVDLLTTATHKWLLGLPGSGFFYVRKDLIERFDPPLPGWLSVANPFDQDVWQLDFAKTAQRFESGMQSLMLLAASKAGLGVLHKFGMANIERAILERSGYLIERLSNLGVTVCTPEEKEHRAGLVSFLIKKHEALYKYLSKNSVVAFHHPDAVVRNLRWTTGGLRVDPTFFNTWEELDELIAAVKRYA